MKLPPAGVRSIRLIAAILAQKADSEYQPALELVPPVADVNARHVFSNVVFA